MILNTDSQAVYFLPAHPRDLFLAIRHKDAGKVAQLLQNGADSNWQNRDASETALAYAARVSTADVVGVLLAHGATDHGQMPLIEAVSWNRDTDEDLTSIALLLLQHGGDVNRTDEEGWTPLMEAASAGCLAVVKLYIERGANVCAVDVRGATPLSVAVHNRHEDVVKLLRKAGA